MGRWRVKVCLLSGDTAINQDLRGIIPKQPGSLLPTRYLFYWFEKTPSAIAPHIDQRTLPFPLGLAQRCRAWPPQGQLCKVAQVIPLPPLPEQKRIVAILDEAFAGIATAVANTEKNLANAP